MGELPHRQSQEDPRPELPAALDRWRDVLRSVIGALQDFGNRKRLTDEMLQIYIDDLNKIAMEISKLIMNSPRNVSRRLQKLLNPILAALRKLDEAKEAYLRGNDSLWYVDQAFSKLLEASSEFESL